MFYSYVVCEDIFETNSRYDVLNLIDFSKPKPENISELTLQKDASEEFP